MDRGLPTLAGRVLQADARVVAPSLIEEVNLSIGERAPHEPRDRVNRLTKLVLHCPTFFKRGR